MTIFKKVKSVVDFPSMEKRLLEYWSDNKVVEKYLSRNDDSRQQFSFLDGPITANNPMGVHHAWGRTYKDLWQRFYNMKGFKQRFQNGFDEQGLWVEVEVEKELGLKTKKDIENLVPGDKFASLEKFINLCKARVEKYSAIQTEQSRRLGYFMDWENSYHTSSNENNYTIWHFLKVINDKGWLYKGHDSVPWCPRCGTAISQHEILTEVYKQLTHESVYFKLPIVGRENEYLLVWTTTPWTIPANVAVAVNAKELYVGFEVDNQKLWVMNNTLERLIDQDVLPKVPSGGEKLMLLEGLELVGWEYTGPFDEFEKVKEALAGNKHRVVATDEQILPVSSEDGTGLVHIAPGAGSEDFQLGQKLGLPVIEVIDEAAYYIEGFEDLVGKNANDKPELIIDYLKTHEKGQFLLKTVPFSHRYPTCWRCKSELVWRVVDEWYIAMDRPDDSGLTYREQMINVASKITWIPKWGLDRELDWLKNMHDWLISKKRYWGLALPIWECSECGSFVVVDGENELEKMAASGWEKFKGHSPHRPWIDQIKLKCPNCQNVISRIPDVGNPWLDAGIVPFSTMPKEWFPADFITEGFPGQFKNWFYSMIAMSTALEQTNPFLNLLGFANVVDEKGEEMHKSKGNSIEFNAAADKSGVDVMRWLFTSANPEVNLKFGFNVIDEIRRRFYLIFWNTYKFFTDYALTVGWQCENKRGQLTILDRWILAKLSQLVIDVNQSLKKFDAQSASQAIENYIVDDFSTWYIRRIRDRVTLNADPKDRNVALSVIFGNLVTLSKLLAPFMPFISEEIYQNLTGDISVHLSEYPKGDKSLLAPTIIDQMKVVRAIVELGHAKRKESVIKLRQPLASLTYNAKEELSQDLELIIAEELNVKAIKYQQSLSSIEDKKSSDNSITVELDTKITPSLMAEGQARDLIRQIQQLRKDKGLTLHDKLASITAPQWPKDYEETILKSTNALTLIQGNELSINN